jgi:hypothetical protein
MRTVLWKDYRLIGRDILLYREIVVARASAPPDSIATTKQRGVFVQQIEWVAARTDRNDIVIWMMKLNRGCFQLTVGFFCTTGERSYKQKRE